jgi:hypothetical protein
MDGLLVLEIKNNQLKEFACGNEDRLLLQRNKPVKIWYSRGFSSLFTIENRIYEVTIDGKSVLKYPYDYKRYLEVEASFWNFTKYSFYLTLFSALMIWIPNRKELPIHRLNRMRLYKKNKGVK